MRKHILNTLPYLLVLASIAVMGAVLYTRQADVLFRQQELSLFLPTRLFYETCCIYPGGTLTWMAAYMTQFFYHPALGVTLLCLAWALSAGLLCCTYRLRGPWVLLTVLAPMALLAAVTQMGYWMYYMKLTGYVWVPTLGVLLSLLLQTPAKHLRGWWRALYIVVVGIAGYPLMGAWSFLALGLLATRRYADASRAQQVTYIAFALVLGAVVPQVCYQWFYTQVMRTQVYMAAMPSFQLSTLDFPEFRRPYYWLALTFLPFILHSWLPRKEGGHPAWVTGIALVLTGLMIWGVHSRWYKDTNFLKEIRMMNSVERLDWEAVPTTMRDNTIGETMPPTRLMVMLKNLALFRLGRAGNEMFHYPEGSEQYCLCGHHCILAKGADGKKDTVMHVPVDGHYSHTPYPIHITQVGGKALYYFYGKEQFCYRWCMEDGVEFGWNVNVLKYMAKTSLVSHEWELARKYLDLLKKTRYHKAWAEHYEQFLRSPETLAKDEEFVSIVPMADFTDRLDGDKTLVEMYLLRTFSSGQGADIYYQEMTLICAMIVKSIELFWPRFLQYISMHQGEKGFRVPTHYQEAAYLYSMLEPQKESLMWPGLTNAEAMSRIPFDESVKTRYQAFIDFNKQCGSMTDEQKARAFYPQFGDTFYYFYFLVRNQKTN